MFVIVYTSHWDGDNDNPKVYGPFLIKVDALDRAKTLGLNNLNHFKSCGSDYDALELESGQDWVAVIDSETTYYEEWNVLELQA